MELTHGDNLSAEHKGIAGFEIFTAVNIESNVFWNMTACSLLMFWRNKLSPFPGPKSKPSNQQIKQDACCWLGLLFNPEDGHIHSYKTSTNFYRTTHHHIPDSTLEDNIGFTVK
jgi:hypothetical protein